jgi:Fe-S-cluster containining protein
MGSGSRGAVTPEKELERLYATLPKINCRRLCQECCGPINMTELELRRLSEQFPALPSFAREMPIALSSGQVVSERGFATDCHQCPMLKDGACSVYPIRPMICRLWGLVQSMRCPHGCTPERWVSPRESFKLLSRADQISRKAMRKGANSTVSGQRTI